VGANGVATATTGNGGGVDIVQSTAQSGSASTTLTNDTFMGNGAGDHGGGLALTLAGDGTGTNTAKLTSLTAYNNSAATDGGGLFVDSALMGAVSVDNSILAGNTVSANGYNGPVDVTMTNNNTALDDYGWNLVGTTDTMFDDPLTDILNDNPGLANTLANNGGPLVGSEQTMTLPTLALSNTSPGYRTGDQNLTNTLDGRQLDERGFTRQTGKVSIGAEDPDTL
jgi:hypothetical protein